MKATADLFDIVRIDHFIGFANYYSIKHGMPDARKGKWVIGEGTALFKVLKKKVPDIRIVAEDLGCVNKRVRRLLDRCGFPGMKVLTFGFDDDESNPHFPGCYSSNTVVYTGTHDNDTLVGWINTASEHALSLAMKVLHFDSKEQAADAFIRAVFESPCDTAVIPMQDLLKLGTEARMNLPGTIGGNWLWRMKPDSMTLELSMKYSKLNAETNRR